MTVSPKFQPFLIALAMCSTVSDILELYSDASAAGFEMTLSHEIEDRAHDGTIYAEAFDMLCSM